MGAKQAKVANVPVRVRPARRSDAPDIARLGAALARHVADPDPGLTPERVIALGFGPRRLARYLVATQDGAVRGVAVLGCWVDLHMNRPTLYLSDLVVDEGARGAGVGRTLLAASAREALRLHAVLRWEVWGGNESALAFYDAVGARPLEEGVVTMALEGEGLRKLPGV